MANKTVTLEMLRAKYAGRGVTITQGHLRSDLLVTGATNSLKFNFLDNQPNGGANNLTPKERGFRLKISDAFCVTGWQLALYKAAAAEPTDLQIIQAVDYSYPNPTVWSGANEAIAFEAIYNSPLSVVINKQEIVSQYMCKEFRRVNSTQKGQVTAAITGPATYEVDTEEQNGAANGYVSVDPTFNMKGGWDLSFQINLGAAATLTGTTSVNYVSMIMKGFLIANGSGLVDAVQY